MAMARWDSMCVLRYLKDTVLHDITEVYKQGVAKVAKDKSTKAAKVGGDVFTKKLLNAVDKLTEEAAQRDK